MPKILYILFIMLFACKARQAVVVVPPQVETVQAAPDTVKQIVQDSIKKEKESFSVLLLLSLNGQHYLQTDSTGAYINTVQDPLHQSSLHFYEGWKMAANEGGNYIKSTVIDAPQDSLKLKELFRRKEVGAFDLIIANVSSSMNQLLSSLAMEAGRPVLFLSNATAAPVTSNKAGWLALPSNKSQCRQMTYFIKNNNPKAGYRVLYRESSKNEAELASLFYSELLGAGVDSSDCKKIIYIPDEWNNLAAQLDSLKRNILFIPTSDESFISSVLTKLDVQEQFDVTIAGLPTWENFGSVDPVMLERFNTHIFSSSWLEYGNEKVKAFRSAFISRNFTDPVFAAYQAYDIYNWIASNRLKNGHLDSFESTASLQSPLSGFEFRRICDQCGYENQYISVLKYTEGLLEKVNR